MRRRRNRLGVVLVVLGLLVAGCSDSEGNANPTTEPAPEPTTTTEEPTSPAPGPTPWPEPTRPEAMDRQDVEGATAAGEFFLELFTYVHLTGDFDGWEAMSHPQCVFCRSVADEVGDLYASGGYADGPILSVVESGAMPPDQDYEFFSVRIEVDEQASTWFDADGAVLETSEAGRMQIDLALMWTEDGWTVRGVATTSAGEEEA